jgi:two-component system, NtrC family, sensor histidine kinase HydH
MRLGLRTKAIAAATLFMLIIVSGAVYFIVTLQRSVDDVVGTTTQLTEAAVSQLKSAGQQLVTGLVSSETLIQPSLTRSAEKHIDSLLAAITANELSTFSGMEGGFYFPGLDEFLGYSFPTSPLPKPAFGPPPRSYEIIREQARQSIEQRRHIVQVHQFDPATFPLVTEPIILNGKAVGCVWARTHIERLIPTVPVTSILIVAAALSIIGFTVAMTVAWNLRKRIEEIRIGLHRMHSDGQHRLRVHKGVFGDISRSINATMDARAEDQMRRVEMEREMHQQDKMATLGTLVAGLAHEVKTPLAIIKTRIQMWERKLRPDAGGTPGNGIISEDSIRLVNHEIDRLTDLVRRLLVFAKPVSNRMEPVDLNELLTRMIAFVQSDTQDRQITVAYHPGPSVPMIPLDPHAIEQVILNILSNSIEAMPSGGALAISSNIRSDASAIQVDITDSGHGIPPEHLDRIFNPFFTTKEHGSGLGLAISNEIIRAHGGSIEFLPPAGGNGTHCRITLPVQQLPV